jgi:hypothetical protein
MCGKCRRKGIERRGYPDTPTSHGTPGELSQCRKQQEQLPNTETGDENLDQTASRPAFAGKALIERTEARGKDFRARGTDSAPEARMLE